MPQPFQDLGRWDLDFLDYSGLGFPRLGLRVFGLEFRFSDLGSGCKCLRIRVWGVGFQNEGVWGFLDEALGVRVQRFRGLELGCLGSKV